MNECGTLLLVERRVINLSSIKNVSIRSDSSEAAYIRRNGTVTSPVVIHIERNEAQHRDIKADMPSRIYSGEIVLRFILSVLSKK
jgi:hypothetical protein